MKIKLNTRNAGILITCVLLAVLGFLAFFIGREQNAATTTPSGRFLLTTLSFFNILLLMVLLVVLFRELVKGFLSWRRLREGARYRTRLLISFVLLGLFPSLLLFVGAITMIESTVDRWFSSPVNSLVSASQELVDKTMDMAREQSFRKASALARQLRQVPAESRAAAASQLFTAGDADAYCLLDASGKVLARAPETFPDPDQYKVERAFGTEGLNGWIDIAPVPTVTSGVAVDKASAVFVANRLPAALFGRAQFIAENNKQYMQLRSQRQTLKISMISSFLALTLLVTFVAVWVGSRLSREISVPLQLLLEGTQEVSRGNLAHSIPYDARDEIGLVVASFNQMTRELETSKSELEGSKSELERSNLELRTTTETAERRRRYIETLLETLNIGVVSTEADGQVRTLNPKALEILGLAPGEPHRAILSRPEWAPVGAVLASLPSRPITNREVTLTTKKGQAILSVTATPLKDPHGAFYGNLIILEDITNLSRAQRIAAWQEAAQRMAHEIKNPLTPIRLSAQRIRKKVREKAQDLEPAVMEGCTTIEKEVEAMMTMVNEFSRFARLPEVHLKASSLPALIQSTVAPYKATYKKVAFNVEVPPQFPPVRMDAEQMGRVFKNLIENSMEVMEMVGELNFSLREEGGQALVTIRDTGPGISPEARSRMFLPYFSTKRKGTGLGLAIVTRILEEHGGSIKVEEEYKGGAGFLITLPLG